jgi:hypothetical protein
VVVRPGLESAISAPGRSTDTFSSTLFCRSQASVGVLPCSFYAGPVKLTVEQCRAGRALLNWSAADLASIADLSVITVKRFEGGQAVAASSLAKIADTLTSAGVLLIGDGETSVSGRAGVRLA